MKSSSIKLNVIHLLSAMVWLINGLFCKVLDLVPRHQEIVSRILGSDHSPVITLLIGLAETGMAVWILSGIRQRVAMITQIVLVAVMNTIELIFVPDLLLWGNWNALFAFVFIVILYINEFSAPASLTRKPC